MPRHDSKIQTLIERLQQVGSAVPNIPCVYPLQSPVFGDGVSEEDIVSLEAITKVPLDGDFLLFQRLCGSVSAMDIWNGYSLMEASHIKALITNIDSPQVIWVTHNQSNMLPIGGDGGGNMFLMSLADNNHVLKWNHETGAQVRLANNFAEFLERMLKDWEQFVAQDSSWNYMSD